MARRILSGKIVKISNVNTATVRVETKFRHPKYGKTVKSHKTYLSATPIESTYKVGEEVMIGEIKPLSKRKYFEVISKLEIK